MSSIRKYIPAFGLATVGLLLIGIQLMSPRGASLVRLATAVQIWSGKGLSTHTSYDGIPANLIAQSGVRMFPGDQILLGGAAIKADFPLQTGSLPILQWTPAIPITLRQNNQDQVIYSTAATLGEALWQAGIRLDPEDKISPALETPLTGPVNVKLDRARDLVILQAGQETRIHSAASTVGEALADAGIALQGLDYTEPREDQLIPASGRIQVVRVQEQVLLEQKAIPFESQYQADPETELGQRSVLQPGVTGLIVTRVRVRLEGGKEITRQNEGVWTARLPQNQLVGYGTKVVIHTETVDGVTIQYWHKITAYATSYAPCEIYPDHCSFETASGMTLQKGVVALVRSMYNALKGTQVYIPGYGQGTVADIGGGVGGVNWIDLGYSDSDYVSWHSNVTVYFLAPAPANISWALP